MGATGHVMTRFTVDEDEKDKLNVGSGNLIKKIDDKTYLLLTAAHLFERKSGEDMLEMNGGMFLLQRHGDDDYACRFMIDPNSVQKYTDYDAANHQGNDF